MRRLRKLDGPARALLVDTIVAVERRTDEWGDAERKKQEAKMYAAGMKDLRLQGAEAQRYYAAAYGSLWSALEKRLPKDEVEELRKAFYKE